VPRNWVDKTVIIKEKIRYVENFVLSAIALIQLLRQWLQIQFGKNKLCISATLSKNKLGFPIKINRVSVHDSITDSPKSDSTDAKSIKFSLLYSQRFLILKTSFQE
jgi:hypothetical protein